MIIKHPPKSPAAATAAAATTTTAAAATKSAAAATTAAATKSTTTAAATGFAGLGFVDGEVAAVDVLAVEGSHRGLAVLIACELDEAEAAGAAGFAVHDEGRGSDIAVLREDLAETLLGGAERQIANVELHDAFHTALETKPDTGA